MHSIQDVNNKNDADQEVLRVEHLNIAHQQQVLVQDLNFRLHAGDTLAIVGESGSGKSISSLAILGLLPRNLRIQGNVQFEGHALLGLSSEQHRKIGRAHV